MALTTRTNGQQITPASVNDFKDLLTGVMTDQPVTMNYRPGSLGTVPTLLLKQNGNAPLIKGLKSDDTTQAFLIDQNGKISPATTAFNAGVGVTGIDFGNGVTIGVFSGSLTTIDLQLVSTGNTLVKGGQVMIKGGGGGNIVNFQEPGGSTKASIDTNGVLTIPQVAFNGTLGSGNKIADLQQSYGLFSDNTGAVGTTRVWVDGPDRGELQLGPRSGANYFDWIRLRATKLTIDLGKNTSPNSKLFEVTGGPTQLDGNTISTNGSGQLTAASLVVTGNISSNSKNVPYIVPTGASTAGRQIFTGTTAPGSPNEGDIWLKA